MFNFIADCKVVLIVYSYVNIPWIWWNATSVTMKKVLFFFLFYRRFISAMCNDRRSGSTIWDLHPNKILFKHKQNREIIKISQKASITIALPTRDSPRIGEKGGDLTQPCDKNPYTHRTIQKATWQHKNATKNFDYTTIADQLRTVSWSNSSHPTSVVKPVYERSTFPLTATAV